VKHSIERTIFFIGFSFSIPVTLTYLVYLEWGHEGLRAILYGAGVLSLIGIAWALSHYGAVQTSKNIALGANLVTRHDYVDAMGDGFKAMAENGKRPTSLPTPQQLPEPPSVRLIESANDNDFDIVPFKLPTKLKKGDS
jgi:hypothetical protein